MCKLGQVVRIEHKCLNVTLRVCVNSHSFLCFGLIESELFSCNDSSGFWVRLQARFYCVDFITSYRKYTFFYEPIAQPRAFSQFYTGHECCDPGAFQKGALLRRYQHDKVESVSLEQRVHSYCECQRPESAALQVDKLHVLAAGMVSCQGWL